MEKPGHIRLGIDRKVYFEPDGLPEPVKRDPIWVYAEQHQQIYDKEMKEYEASKQLIEVSNKVKKLEKVFVPPMSEDIIDKWFIEGLKTFGKQRIYGGEPCKAEVTGDTCTIVELIK